MEWIKVIVRGGVVQDVLNIPKGLKVEVWDYDVDRDEPDERLQRDDDGDHAIVATYEGGLQ